MPVVTAAFAPAVAIVLQSPEIAPQALKVLPERMFRPRASARFLPFAQFAKLFSKPREAASESEEHIHELTPVEILLIGSSPAPRRVVPR
jgi:hypothetical protein